MAAKTETYSEILPRIIFISEVKYDKISEFYLRVFRYMRRKAVQTQER